jgi:hypothetical protein
MSAKIYPFERPDCGASENVQQRIAVYSASILQTDAYQSFLAHADIPAFAVERLDREPGHTSLQRQLIEEKVGALLLAKLRPQHRDIEVDETMQSAAQPAAEHRVPIYALGHVTTTQLSVPGERNGAELIITKDKKIIEILKRRLGNVA